MHEHQHLSLRCPPAGASFSIAWPRVSVNPLRWVWKHCKDWHWNFSEHINVLEFRAYVMCLRWRARNVHKHSKWFLHLLDSQVALAVAVKHRSSSKKLNPSVRQASALVLAAHMYELLGYVSTELNPADEGSRL